MLLHVLHEPCIHCAVHHVSDIGVAQLCLGLALKLRLGKLDADYCGKPLPRILAGEVCVVILQYLVLSCIVVDHPCQRSTEAHQMAAALDGVNVVGIGEHVLVVAVVILHGYFNACGILLAFDLACRKIDRLRMQDFLIFV